MIFTNQGIILNIVYLALFALDLWILIINSILLSDAGGSTICSNEINILIIGNIVLFSIFCIIALYNLRWWVTIAHIELFRGLLINVFTIIWLVLSYIWRAKYSCSLEVINNTIIVLWINIILTVLYYLFFRYYYVEPVVTRQTHIV